MTTPVGILFQFPFVTALSTTGTLLPGFTATFYLTGTLTPANVFSDGACTVSIGNIVTADATGTLPAFYLSPTTTYKVIFNVVAAGAQLRSTVDPLVVPAATTAITYWYGGVDSGSANAYAIAFSANFTALASGIFITWVPNNTNTGNSTLNVNTLGNVNILTLLGAALPAGALQAGVPVTTLYYAGNHYLLGASAAGNVNATGNVALGATGKTLQGWGQTSGAYEDMSPDHSSWSSTASGGYTANPSGTLKWRKTASMVEVYSDAQLTGTSNAATDITLSGLPAEITPAAIRKVPCSGLVNNGNVGYTGVAEVNINNTITVRLTQVSGTAIVETSAAWATANAKGLDAGWTITYPL